MARITAHRASGILFSGMAAISVGFITMTSFMIVFPGASLALAIAVFFAGCFVEADVYLPGVTGGFKNLFFKWGWLEGLFKSLEYAMHKLAIRQYFKEKNENVIHLMVIVDNLRSHTDFLKALGFSDAEIQSLAKLKATQFVEKLLSQLNDKKITEISPEMKLSIEERTLFDDLLAMNKQFDGAAFKQKLYRRKILAVVALIAALGTGLAFGAITFTHVSSAMLAMAGLAALSAASPAWVFAGAGVLAGFAAVAYFMMMYYTLAKAIEGNFIQQIKLKLSAAFAPKSELKTPVQKLFYALNCFFKAVVLAGVVALCVIVTMATADAWFNSSERFFAMMGSSAFQTIPLYATVISYVLVWALFFPITTLFSIETSGNSLEGLWENLIGLRKRWQELREAIILRWQNETTLQFFNPFRLIAAVLESVLATAILGAHVGVSGVLPGEGASENGFMAKILPALPATISGSVVELTVDADFVVGGHHHDHDHHSKLNKNNLAKGLVVGHDHDHNDGLTAKIVTAIVFVPKYLGFVWDSVASGKWTSYHEYKERRPDQYQTLASADADGDDAPSIADAKGTTQTLTHAPAAAGNTREEGSSSLPDAACSGSGAILVAT